MTLTAIVEFEIEDEDFEEIALTQIEREIANRLKSIGEIVNVEVAEGTYGEAFGDDSEE